MSNPSSFDSAGVAQYPDPSLNIWANPDHMWEDDIAGVWFYEVIYGIGVAPDFSEFTDPDPSRQVNAEGDVPCMMTLTLPKVTQLELYEYDFDTAEAFALDREVPVMNVPSPFTPGTDTGASNQDYRARVSWRDSVELPDTHGPLRASTTLMTDADGAPYWDMKIDAQLHEDGEAVYKETLYHEFGHVVTDILGLEMGVDEVKTQVCALFGADEADWEDPAEWADRVKEAAAETFKDIMLPTPLRDSDNRTNHQLPFDAFQDFLTLYIDHGWGTFTNTITNDGWGRYGFVSLDSAKEAQGYTPRTLTPPLEFLIDQDVTWSESEVTFPDDPNWPAFPWWTFSIPCVFGINDSFGMDHVRAGVSPQPMPWNGLTQPAFGGRYRDTRYYGKPVSVEAKVWLDNKDQDGNTHQDIPETDFTVTAYWWEMDEDLLQYDGSIPDSYFNRAAIIGQEDLITVTPSTPVGPQTFGLDIPTSTKNLMLLIGMNGIVPRPYSPGFLVMADNLPITLTVEQEPVDPDIQSPPIHAWRAYPDWPYGDVPVSEEPEPPYVAVPRIVGQTADPGTVRIGG